MNNESIADKISELFDLFNSGALSAEEYNLLKSQIISGAKELTLIKTEPLNNNAVVNCEKINNQDSNLSTSINKNQPNKDEKKQNRSIVIISVVVILVIALIVFYSTNSTTNNNSENINKTSINNPISIENEIEWNEDAAKQLVLGELSNYKEWDEPKDKWHHGIISFTPMTIDSKDLKIALTFSNYEENNCHACYGLLSVFVLEKQSKWQITQKSFKFAYGDEFGEIPPKMKFIILSDKKFALLIENESGNADDAIFTKSVYSFINRDFKEILNHSYELFGEFDEAKQTYLKRYSANLKIISNDKDYCDILIEEKIESERKETKTELVRYTFNGSNYTIVK